MTPRGPDLAGRLFGQMQFSWDTTTPVHLCIACGCFCAAMGYLSRHNTDDLAHKNANIYYLRPFTERVHCPCSRPQGLRRQGHMNPSGTSEPLHPLWGDENSQQDGEGPALKGRGQRGQFPEEVALLLSLVMAGR